MLQTFYSVIGSGKCRVHLKTVLDDADHPDKIVLFTHGFSSSKDGHSALTFAEYSFPYFKDFIYMAFDWPGHGESKSDALRLDKCTEYMNCVLDYLKEKYPALPVYVYGTSFGGYLPLKYIYEHGMKFEKAALRCPAVNMFEVLTGSIFEAGQLSRIMAGETLDIGLGDTVKVSREYLKDLEQFDVSSKDYTKYCGRLLILQGTKDELVPYETVRRFAECNNIEFHEYPGADHRYTDDDDMRKAVKDIADYFELKPR